MIDKIVLFNHYHRGDIFTNREFIKHLRSQLPDIRFSYLHFNHPKLTRDMEIPLIGSPDNLNQHSKFFFDKDTLYINTWIGADPEFMAKHKGLNLHAMYEQWLEVYAFVSKTLGKEIFIYADKEDYLPSVEFSHFNTLNIDNYLNSSDNMKRLLICNGVPKSGQSFSNDMAEFINETAKKFAKVDFICTQRFPTDNKNVLFTDDIIGDIETVDKRAPWEDKDLNICDLLEISYLSEKCDIIIGKNSGPAVFCETHNNFMDPTKHFISYVVRWNSGNIDSESLSYNLNIECEYEKILIEQRDPLSEKDIVTIRTSLNNALNNLLA